MSEVIIASTTDDQAAVNAAAGGRPQDEALPLEKPAPTGSPQVENEPEPEPVEAKEPEKQAEEKPPKSLSKKFDKLYREKKELEERLAAIEAKQAPPAEKKEEPAPVPTEVASKFDTFDSWSEKQLAAGKAASLDDFLEARDAWKDARKAQQEEQNAQKAYEQEVEGNYQTAVDAFKAEHEDWDEVVGEAEISIPVVAGNAIKQLENGPAVVYFLASNPKAAQKISEMPPVLAVAEIGRIAARLEKAPAEETPTNNVSTKNPDRAPVVSKAPAPITPLKGGNLRVTTKDLNDPELSFSEWRKIRDEQAKQRFRR